MHAARMADCEYRLEGNYLKLTKEMKTAYHRNGYLIVRGLLNNAELKQLQVTLEGSDAITKHRYGFSDGEGKKTQMALWSYPGDDVTGVISRSEKVLGTCQELLGGDELYHFESKLMMKEAKTGGKHLWHQDYGYWYNNGCLFPDLITVFVAYDRATKENGCLQILPGSHKCGRIDHLLIAGQTGADLERVHAIQQKCPPVYVEMEPGDALFFHSNLLHTSAGNDSDQRRWSILVSYNRVDNEAVLDHPFGKLRKLVKVPNEAILKCQNYTNMDGKEFLDPRNDANIALDDACQ
ncbi:probable phytanoyl-CoA dioxygenase [Mizuhopecten yessoensis]|uniref:Phytanoyl-CoA dioxygenase n=1 Tax=Mizuhopecten yessoensis TaxID=6573 RepID=A0A210QMG9_MIZYE|nr:probable phytanoyl-CoA dioxygenase [Mizuhopecten yessoensis]OWF49926.1 phytanoyl-CoA dioxygenase [Mizuhopecten yessoensis]